MHRLHPRSAITAAAFAAAVLCAPATHAAPVCTGNCSLGPLVQAGLGNGGAGALSLLGGSQLSTGSSAFVGAFGNSHGDLVVSGTGSTFAIGGVDGSGLFVGAAGGSGNARIERGGLVTIDAFNAAPNFGDARLFLGVGGTGSVTLAQGGRLVVQDRGPYGREDGINIGLSSVHEGVDRAGNGSLSLDTGSALSVIGNRAYINVGGSHTSSSGLSPAAGRLDVTGGSTVQIDGTTGYGYLGAGRGASSTGVINVSGAGSRIDITGTSGSFAIGNAHLVSDTLNGGFGLLDVRDGGEVHVAGTRWTETSYIGFGLGTGVVRVGNGGSIVTDGRLNISQNAFYSREVGWLDAQQGYLLLGDGGRVQAEGMVVGNGTRAEVNGTLAGTGLVVSDVLVQRGGLLSPGHSPGTLTIEGDLSFAGGVLRIEVESLLAGGFDILKVLGEADLDDALIEFAFSRGFTPRAGEAFTFLQATSMNGWDRATYRYTGLAPGLSFRVADFEGGLRFVADSDGQPVPEPSTLALWFAAALAGWLAPSRRWRALAKARERALHAGALRVGFVS